MLKVRILTASILGVGLLVSLFAVPPQWTALIFAAVFTLAAWEWAGFGGLAQVPARLAVCVVFVALLALAWRFSAGAGHLVLLLGCGCIWWCLALLWLAIAPERQRAPLTLCCGIPVLVPAFLALTHVLQAEHGFATGPTMVLWMLLLVFAADVGAYFAGRAFGRHRLAPRVSPAKTWEGVVGGMVAVAVTAAAATLYCGLPVAAGMAFGCAVGAFSVIGDLTESMFKRAAGLKDSGRLLPGHGGVLDRIDSVTAAAPLYALGLFGSGVIR